VGISVGATEVLSCVGAHPPGGRATAPNQRGRHGRAQRLTCRQRLHLAQWDRGHGRTLDGCRRARRRGGAPTRAFVTPNHDRGAEAGPCAGGAPSRRYDCHLSHDSARFRCRLAGLGPATDLDCHSLNAGQPIHRRERSAAAAPEQCCGGAAKQAIAQRLMDAWCVLATATIGRSDVGHDMGHPGCLHGKRNRGALYLVVSFRRSGRR
jgi:hypothetical protein